MTHQICLYNFKIYILLFFMCSISFPQTTLDIKFVNGAGPRSKIDKEGNFHLSWGGGYDAIWYGIFDSTGTNIKKFKFPDSEGCCGEANFDLKNNTAAIAWTYISQTFNTYVFVQTFSTFQDSVNANHINIDSYGDANRAKPAIDFITDTTFIVSWYGHGRQTDINTGIYGRIANTTLSNMDEIFFISDSINFKTNAILPKMLVNKYSNNFLALWNDNRTGFTKVYGKLFDYTGTTKGNSFLISEYPDSGSIYYLTGAVDERNGNYAVVWAVESIPFWQIRWRWYDSEGNSLGNSESITLENDNINDFSSVAIDIDRTGKIIVIWHQDYQGFPTFFGQRFTSKDTPYDEAFKISEKNYNNYQFSPSVTLQDDKIYFVWQQHKDSTSEIYGRIIDFYDITLVGVSEISEPINTFNLTQNYPNPFNPVTKINYSIPTLTTNNNFNVQLTVYDILGKKIAVLVNSQQSSGNYEIEFNAGTISSGMYFYQLSFGNMVQTKKMLFVK